MHAIHAAPTDGLLQSAVLFDIYRPNADAVAASLATGEKSLAVRLTLGCAEATLTDVQIDAAMTAVLAHLASQVSARLRA
jgi:phenylalanyl-tRNA synthetase beta chain